MRIKLNKYTNKKKGSVAERKFRKEINAIHELSENHRKSNKEWISTEIHKLKERIESRKPELQNAFLKNNNNKSINKELRDIKVTLFSLMKLICNETFSITYYDSQIIAGLTLSDGNIAEMNTGEGKTLSATLPVALSALLDLQPHVITVNDYLSERDARSLSPLYEKLGLTVGVLLPEMPTSERYLTYKKDIIYGTSSEFAFDFLRSNTAKKAEHQFITERKFALIDEADSILIDDARTPFVLSGADELHPEKLCKIYDFFSEFTIGIENNNKSKAEHKAEILINEKEKSAKLTEKGYIKLEEQLIKSKIIQNKTDLYRDENLNLIKLTETMATAIYAYKLSVDYICHDNEVKIINPSTGRVEDGRRWQDGLHQCIEIKEGVKINPDNKTIASISLQNYFREYSFLCGMTGTAMTEAEELKDTYNLNVIKIPTNKETQRIDRIDKVFLTEDAKFSAIVADIKAINATGRPILIGTQSVQESEIVAKLLKEESLDFVLLNAKNHSEEADIIAKAGELYSITVSTNMAGRGTDILLGGTKENWLKRVVTVDPNIRNALVRQWQQNKNKVVELGGLHVIGTGRNESRRVDNQLIGRSGRQGDPGSSQFYLSFEDSLFSIHGDFNYKNYFKKLYLSETDALQHSLINKGITRSQIKCENRGYNIRSNLLKYDNIVHKQRMEIYNIRNNVLRGNLTTTEFSKNLKNCILYLSNVFLPDDNYIQWDSEGLDLYLKVTWDLEPIVCDMVEKESSHDAIITSIYENALIKIENLINELASLTEQNCDKWDVSNDLFKPVLISLIDEHWQDQIEILDNIKEGIHLRSYAQKNPLYEFGESSLQHFKEMIQSIEKEYVNNIFSCLLNSINFHKSRLLNQNHLSAR